MATPLRRHRSITERTRSCWRNSWTFNLWGSADLLNGFYQASATELAPGQLGAAYFIPTLIVPLLLITHGLMFRVLLQQQSQPAMRDTRLSHAR